MGFYVDLEKTSLEAYKKTLKASDLVPSRMILKERIDTNFELLRKQGIRTVNELLKALKDKQRISEMSEQSGVAIEYLTILAREIKGYRSTPSKMKDFPGIAANSVRHLEEIGIKNALHLFDATLTSKSRAALSEQTGIDQRALLKMTKLADLSRIRWVNHNFAYVLYEAGYDTAEKVAGADPEELFERVKKLNEERNLFPAHIGLRDMKRCVEAAKALPLDVKY